MTDNRRDTSLDAYRTATEDGLDQLGLARVEARLNAALRAPARPAWRWALAGTGLLAASAIAAVLLLLARPPQGAAEPQVPVVKVLRSKGDVRQTLANELDFELGAGGRIELGWADEAEVAVEGPARLTVARARRSLDVADGTAAFRVAPQPENQRLAFAAGDARIVVHGTQFVVRVVGGHLQAVDVSEGVVEVQLPGGESRLLHAAERYRTEGAPDAALWADPFGEGVAPATDDVADDAAPVAADDATPRAPDGRGPAVTPRQGVKSSAVWLAALRDLDARRCGRLSQKVAVLLSAATTSNEKARATMLRAECALRSGQKAEARRWYDTVAGSWPAAPSAETAAFEAAKLRADLGAPAEAESAFAAYVRQYPSGHFVMEATFRRCELQVRLDRHTEAEGCLKRYLDSQGTRRLDALALLGALLRLRQQWSDAAAIYAQLATSPNAGQAEEALFQRAACLKRSRSGELNAAIDAYLARFPQGAHRAEVNRLR